MGSKILMVNNSNVIKNDYKCPLLTFLILMFNHILSGRSVIDYTSLKFFLTQVPYLSWLSPVVPSFIRLPRFVLALASSHFWKYIHPKYNPKRSEGFFCLVFCKLAYILITLSCPTLAHIECFYMVTMQNGSTLYYTTLYCTCINLTLSLVTLLYILVNAN